MTKLSSLFELASLVISSRRSALKNAYEQGTAGDALRKKYDELETILKKASHYKDPQILASKTIYVVNTCISGDVLSSAYVDPSMAYADCDDFHRMYYYEHKNSPADYYCTVAKVRLCTDVATTGID